MSPVRFPKGFAIVLGVWLVAALSVSAAGALERLPRPALQVILVALTVALLLACRAAPSLRTWAMRGDLRWLVGLHVSRLAAGLAFLGYASRGELPWGFATPAGVGDAVVAVLAAGVCLRPQRGPVLAWNGLGFLDILSVVAAAARFGVADPASMAPLARLPLSLLPTFLVPLIIASHVVIFARYAPARR